MKYVSTAQFVLCFFVVSCSTNVTPGSSENTGGNKAVVKNPSSNSTTVRTTGIRTMQKYFRPAGAVSGTVRIVIDKSDFQLRVYDSKGLLATYPVVFGNKFHVTPWSVLFQIPPPRTASAFTVFSPVPKYIMFVLVGS